MIVWSLCCGFLLVGRGPQLSLLSSPKMSFLSGKVPPVLPHVRGAWLPVGYLGEYCRMHWPSFSFVAGQRLHLYYRHKPTVVEADQWWLWGSLPLTVDAVEGMLRDTVLLPVAEHVTWESGRARAMYLPAFSLNFDFEAALVATLWFCLYRFYNSVPALAAVILLLIWRDGWADPRRSSCSEHLLISVLSFLDTGACLWGKAVQLFITAKWTHTVSIAFIYTYLKLCLVP